MFVYQTLWFKKKICETFLDSNRLFLSLKTSPALENNLSHGTDVAMIQRRRLTNS